MDVIITFITRELEFYQVFLLLFILKLLQKFYYHYNLLSSSSKWADKINIHSAVENFVKLKFNKYFTIIPKRNISISICPDYYTLISQYDQLSCEVPFVIISVSPLTNFEQSLNLKFTAFFCSFLLSIIQFISSQLIDIKFYSVHSLL